MRRTRIKICGVTRAVDAGISVSRWEGFNLPVVELQYLEKHAFAYRLAAHPEVVVSGEQLCAETIAALAQVPGVAGVHVFAPGGASSIPRILSQAGLRPRRPAGTDPGAARVEGGAGRAG